MGQEGWRSIWVCSEVGRSWVGWVDLGGWLGETRVVGGFWLLASGEGRRHGRGAELRVVVACMMGSFV